MRVFVNEREYRQLTITDENGNPVAKITKKVIEVGSGYRVEIEDDPSHKPQRFKPFTFSPVSST